MLLLCDGDKWKSHFCVSQELVKNLENGVMENEVVNVFFFRCLFFPPSPVHRRRRNRNFVFLRAQLEGHKNDQSLSYWELWTLLWVEDEVVKKNLTLAKDSKTFLFHVWKNVHFTLLRGFDRFEPVLHSYLYVFLQNCFKHKEKKSCSYSFSCFLVDFQSE